MHNSYFGALVNDQYISETIALYDQHSNIASNWWLRSPGESSRRAVFIAPSGLTNVYGEEVDNIYDSGVRPALWLNVDPSFTFPPPPVSKNIKSGMIVQFGKYTWRVLEVQEGKALILSDAIIEIRAYNEKELSVTWESCTLRKYLNGEFYNSFSESNKQMIADTKVISNKNPWFMTKGGKNTSDFVFLLSIEEVVKFFGDSG